MQPGSEVDILRETFATVEAVFNAEEAPDSQTSPSGILQDEELQDLASKIRALSADSDQEEAENLPIEEPAQEEPPKPCDNNLSGLCVVLEQLPWLLTTFPQVVLWKYHHPVCFSQCDLLFCCVLIQVSYNGLYKTSPVLRCQ